MSTHTKSVFAVRDTELIQFPARLLHHIKRLYPIITEYVINNVVQRLESEKPISLINQDSDNEVKYQIQASSLANISTIAVVCSDSNSPIESFIDQLKDCLSLHGNVICLSSQIVENQLGKFALTDR